LKTLVSKDVLSVMYIPHFNQTLFTVNRTHFIGLRR